VTNAQRPSDQVFTTRTPRVASAVKLHRRREREKAGRFLAEGPQAVREALAAGAVRELFVTDAGWLRHRELVTDQAPFSVVTEDAMAALADTVTPQGVIAVCDLLDVPLPVALSRQPRLVAVAVEIRDPGNAGTILRTADAAGASAVIFAGDAVDPHNPKCVRASAGSIFHLDVVRAPDAAAALRALTEAGLSALATSGYGDVDLDELADSGVLADRTAWLFGSEAHGLPAELLSLASRSVRVPIHGRAESLNLAAAAAVFLSASARAHR
jgi:RNA methyltransferase, TrmH family